MNSLPIDQILPALCLALSENKSAVLQAAPGAGKTTRVPLELLDQPWLAGKSILMLQPRRLAARHAAEYMAELLGEKVGQRIGYSIRFERKRSQQTRLEIVTEGILTRRLQSDPELSGIGLVIFDEFHERNINSDLALALCRDTQLALREDLKLLVMSATLDAEPISVLLDHCPILTSPGRSFPIETRYLPQPSERNSAESVAAGIRTALRDTSGDILAFLPGAGEIRRCAGLLTDLTGVAIRPLFGGMPFAEQRQAIEPGDKRRVVLATNIAETSLTIDGITTVVDCGWERRPRFDSGSGLTRLELKRISVASATQRQGRAGRLGPGTCYRLWSEAQQAELLPQTPPEIRSADLSPLLLELACWGETAPERLSWLDVPPPAPLQQARQLLVELKSLTPDGQATRLGQRMVRLPLPPRLARLVLAADEDHQTALGCDLAALLSERDLLPKSALPLATDCDLETRWRLLQRLPRVDGAKTVLRVAEDLRRTMNLSKGANSWPDKNDRVQRWLVLAWPDRISRQREAGSDRYLLSSGGGAVLSCRSGLPKPTFLVALDLDQRNDQAEITIASTLERTTLEEIFADRLQPRRQVSWDKREERVVAREVIALGALILAECPVKATSDEQLQAALVGVRDIGIERLNWTREALQLCARVAHCAANFPQDGWPDLSFDALTSQLEDWLGPYLTGVTTRAELERFNPYTALKNQLSWDLLARLEQLAPERIEIPSGAQIRIDYCAEGSPLLAAKLQELFGLKQTPAILDGRLPLLIHPLSPAGRPLAVTQDLRYFWDHAYPEIRKEMRGRYPKHPWPEDPWNAQATAKTNKSLQKSRQINS